MKHPVYIQDLRIPLLCYVLYLPNSCPFKVAIRNEININLCLKCIRIFILLFFNFLGGFGCFRLRTKVIQLTTSKVPQTCFSTEPVPECSAHCQSPGMVSRTVSFHCLPSKDDSTKSLVRESENRVLYELSRKSKDDETTVEVPDGCYKK